MTTAEQLRELKLGTVLPIWGVTVIAAVIIAVASPRDEYFTWFSVALAAAVVVTFAAQLSTLT